MAKRKIVLATGEIYHIFNRATAKQTIFGNSRECKRLLDLFQFYQRAHGRKFSSLTQNERQRVIAQQEGTLLAEIIAYCIMPNHFHLLLRQTTEQGITKFLLRLTDAYSHYFNILHDRVGPLFQGNFKAVRIEDNAQLLQVSRYIHLNPVTGFLVKHAEEYRWSSYREFIDASAESICSKEVILGQFKNRDQYKKFVSDYADYAKKIKKIEHLLMEKEKYRSET